jgi:SHS2 domain-containing protein
VYEWRSHTAEIELAIEAESEERVFEEALAAFAELVTLDSAGDELRHEVSIVADDRGSLLVAWLEELIFLADTESFVPERAERLRLSATTLAATLVGRRARVEPLVKAATYHGLHFACEHGMWHARIVLDV